MEKSIFVSASVLNSDVAMLGAEAKKADESGCDMIHIDVMDGVFVGNITYGNVVVNALRKYTDKLLDVHLMIHNPTNLIGLFAQAGSDLITFHAESECDIGAVIDSIHSFGKKAGIAIKPATPVCTIEKYIGIVDMVLVMTVEPGYGGQGFIPATIDKISQVRTLVTEKAPSTLIQVDGGINAETAEQVVRAGANVLVAGTYLFRADDMSKAVEALRRA